MKQIDFSQLALLNGRAEQTVADGYCYYINSYKAIFDEGQSHFLLFFVALAATLLAGALMQPVPLAPLWVLGSYFMAQTLIVLNTRPAR